LQNLKVKDLSENGREWPKEFLKEAPVEGERLVDLGSDGWTIMRRISD
jgi:hypothetical protein